MELGSAYEPGVDSAVSAFGIVMRLVLDWVRHMSLEFVIAVGTLTGLCSVFCPGASLGLSFLVLYYLCFNYKYNVVGKGAVLAVASANSG